MNVPIRELNLIEKRLQSPTVTFVIALAIIGAIVYLSYLLQPRYRGDTLPYTMVIVSEFFLIAQGMLSFWTILNGKYNPRNFEYHNAQDLLFGKRRGKNLIKELPTMPVREARDLAVYLRHRKVTVDVFIPVYGEPVEEIRETVIAARDMYGQHKTHVLDDGKSDQVEAMVKSVGGVQYIRRPTNEHAKAGNINYALSKTSGALFLILDADFVARRDMLYEMMPFFENDRIAFVQSPQYYNNNVNFVSTSAAYMQHVFYAMVMAGKNRFNAAFCVGTNVMFRRSAIQEIGGMYQRSKSEDIWTSLLLHEHGWHSVYINKVLAIGKTPETFKAYAKQQLRWATGSFEIFLRHNPLFDRGLTLDQRLQYFSTTMFYFNGFAIAALLLLPPLQIYFNITPISLDIPLAQWALIYSGFYVMQLFLSFYAMGGMKLSTLVISVASFPVYVKAFFNALRRRDQAWTATNSSSGAYDSPFNYIRFQTYVFLFLLLTMIVGIWKALYTSEFSVSLVWNAVNMILFGYVVWAALREGRRTKRSMRKNRKQKGSSRWWWLITGGAA